MLKLSSFPFDYQKKDHITSIYRQIAADDIYTIGKVERS